jgi:uncharacterized protein
VRLLKLLLSLAVVLYIVALVAVFILQRKFLYFPGHVYVPLNEAAVNPSFRELPVRTEDGLDLKGWYAPATTKPFTIVFFHGNGDNLYRAAHIADPYIAAGYGFLVTEYRGYSGLPGMPTESGLYADGRAYLRALEAQGVKPKNIILFGHSLGTGVATELATESHVGGVMLLAPYLSMTKMAQLHFPLLPWELIARDRYENFKKISSVHAPLLIVNGAQDEVIPSSQGRDLYNLANEPRQFYSIPGRGHNDAFDDFAPLSIGWLNQIATRDNNKTN